jgi:putative Mn2+ efflux pump MntP
MWPRVRCSGWGGLRKGPTLAALYPVVMLGLQAVLAGLTGWGIGWGVAQLVPGWPGMALGFGVGLAFVWAMLRRSSAGIAASSPIT